ncbi:thiamine-phosphate kinase [Snodgrassella sp. CFCC 13594]|uniref:thiamine-phosphate kinase n=1 Tax=Snodgrassella sp. CFCC 13594 TaxID=1775559 RepID=UPI0008369836|nr:thiamine-phosphate kinase [Snodgrassella sp. CFCC 13594]
MNEFDFIQRFMQGQNGDAQLILGIGDDAAIIRPRAGYDLHFSSDMLLAGRHFFDDVAPADLAHKILAVNVSDMAAMGATPRWALLSAALPRLDEPWLKAFCASLFAFAQEQGVVLIGGDTTKGDYVFSVTIIGETPNGQGLRRSGAKPGDEIWVSGQLGLAAAALHHHWGWVGLPDPIFAACEEKRLRPMPRVALGQQLLPLAHAAQDISDGLAQDLGHILNASHVGAVLWADTLPTLSAFRGWAKGDESRTQQLYDWMLAGGDDYELVFTAPAAAHNAVLQAGLNSATAVAQIGMIQAATGLTIQNSQGDVVILDKQGFDHFV